MHVVLFTLVVYKKKEKKRQKVINQIAQFSLTQKNFATIANKLGKRGSN